MKILVVSHGGFSKGLVETSEMIIGESKSVSYMMLDSSDSVERFYEKINEYIITSGEDIIILADLMGGSPMLSSARAMVSLQDNKVGIVTGVNLPMIIEVVSQLDMGNTSFDELINLAEISGKEGIRTIIPKGGEL